LTTKAVHLEFNAIFLINAVDNLWDVQFRNVCGLNADFNRESKAKTPKEWNLHGTVRDVAVFDAHVIVSFVVFHLLELSVDLMEAE